MVQLDKMHNLNGSTGEIVKLGKTVKLREVVQWSNYPELLKSTNGKI